MNPSTCVMDPSSCETGPSTHAIDPLTCAMDHSTRDVDPSTCVMDPEAVLTSRSEPMPGKCECWVRQYVVDVGSCGGLGPRLCVINEIGKMELFSQPYIQAVHQTLSSPVTIVLGTIPAPKGKPLVLVEEIRGRPDVKGFSVSAPCLQAPHPHLLLCPPCSPVLQHYRVGS
ncbi:Cancer-related nucleoside-triphosphatase-like protein [Sciurus carolinensis]|uniref:Cancer-related nucleoside-triphosphatase-like protein n=1 Tax=Sciurus carolinensis TaxID=30640 RepID=A0AA41MFK7_SCICA|nr:Cancer-related nucleoside-triphosphatase-like protein [Sciurus carolinensis]